jgi:hypothetical protein
MAKKQSIKASVGFKMSTAKDVLALRTPFMTGCSAPRTIIQIRRSIRRR